MRTVISILAVLFLCTLVSGQGSITFSFNIGNQPEWGPTGYDYVEYYYMPEIEVYYYVSERRFFYFENGRWIGAFSLPLRYRHYNLFSTYKIILNERAPYKNHTANRSRYAAYRAHRNQSVIRDSRDEKYFINKNHPEHLKWKKKRSTNRPEWEEKQPRSRERK
ncbi:MAG: hypothetical protein WCW35_01865 [Bacteroidota bacterium]|jgi:hypothetical protein